MHCWATGGRGGDSILKKKSNRKTIGTSYSVNLKTSGKGRSILETEIAMGGLRFLFFLLDVACRSEGHPP